MVITSGTLSKVNTGTASSRQFPHVTGLADGGWVVTWESDKPDASGLDISQQVYNADGTKQGGETRVNTYTALDQYGPQVIALSDGGWVVTWFGSGGARQQAYRADGAVRGAETRIDTESLLGAQTTALSDGGWVVTWERPSGGASSDYDVYQQAFRADGTARGGKILVNTATSGDQLAPQITALSDGGWVVMWSSTEGSTDSGPLDTDIYQRAYHANGTARGVAVRVNTHTADFQIGTQITALSDGGWVVTWMSSDLIADEVGINQQVYNANGTKQGNEVQVNSVAISLPEVAALPDGGWVVAWLALEGLRQQAYNANGTKQGGEATITTDGVDPQITVLSDGGWVVTWINFEAGGSTDIYQQVFNADGTLHGGKTRVSSGGLDDDYSPEITALSDGGWVITWTVDGARGEGVYQRTFWLNDAPIGKDIAVQTAQEAKPFSFTVPAGTFADPDALDALTYKATLAGGGALPDWLHFNAATRTFSGTPHKSDVGGLSVRVTATDKGGLSVSEVFTLTVKNLNDAPALPANITAGTFENASVLIDVLSAAYDDDGDKLSILSASVRSGFGSVSIRADGRLVYDPTTAPNQNIAANETRSVIIRYTVSDGHGGKTTADVTVTVKGVEPDIFKGTPGNDSLKGSIHGDILYGYASADLLNGRTGADRMVGGKGDDTYFVENARDTVVETAGEGTDLVRASITYALTANVENLKLTGLAKINGTGNGLANAISGNAAANTLDGKTGADRMAGGKGSDIYVVDNAKDKVVEWTGAGTDLVKASVSYVLSANVEHLTLMGTAASGTGNSLANVIIGNAADNVLNGKAGADRMVGGKGDDIYVVDNAKDKVVEKAGEGTDLVRASVSYALSAYIQKLTLVGSAEINGTGNGLNNIIVGNRADNTLNGRGGADTLRGGAGDDTLIGGNSGGKDKLYGGSGADTFVFVAAQGAAAVAVGNRDAIDDFSRKQGDKIDLSAIDANAKTGASDAFTFIATEQFHNKAGELRYVLKSGDTVILGDTNGDGKADFGIKLDLSLAMKGSDFIL
ncbi:putative Ig domain-containing protein [Shinella sp. CPCC 101442]|uniref:putative Ig domain-containing protein n=1 Tax=Shinella sp. CPCC 101442 TaxID=2932265 RepID=UPI0021536FB0|nr:putative Ig domain-containing protein [Shinella sp. CPCC 101442]MCR6501240.1 putative Ig domain-containing protein [Shinella sp. CPCC 101442]